MERWPFVIRYTLYVSVTSLAAVVVVVTLAFVWMMLDPNVANAPIYGIIGPAFQDTIIAFIGLVAGVGGFIAGKRDSAPPMNQPTESPEGH